MEAIIMIYGVIFIACIGYLGYILDRLKNMALSMDQDRKLLGAAILSRPEGHNSSIINLATRACND